MSGRLEADHSAGEGARCRRRAGLVISGGGEPETGRPDGMAVRVVRAETVDLSDLESADSYDLAVLACRLDIDLADGPGRRLGGHDDTDEEWRRWVTRDGPES